MSDQGPVMLAATAVLRNQETRVGKIAGNISLPRTVALKSLLAGGGGAFFGMVIGLILNPSFDGFLFGAVFGAGAGVFVVTYSPMKGESLLTWLRLSAASQRNRVTIDGQSVRLAVGVCYITNPAQGEVRVVRGAAPVAPTQFDERGVLMSDRNRNLPSELALGKVRSRDLVKGAALPKNVADPLLTKKGKKILAEEAKQVRRPIGGRGQRTIPGQAPASTGLSSFDDALDRTPVRSEEALGFPEAPSEVEAPAEQVQSFRGAPEPVPGARPGLPLPEQDQQVPNYEGTLVRPGSLAERRGKQQAAAALLAENPLDTAPQALPKEGRRRR